MEIKIISEMPAVREGFIYHALKAVNTDKLMYGIEIVYVDNGSNHSISMPDIFDSEKDALEITETFAKEVVYPKQFVETVWDYVTAKKLEAVTK